MNIPFRIPRAFSRIGLMVLGCLWLTSGHARLATVTASQAEIGNAWQTYWADQADFEPTVRFPHMACFRRSARAHHVPLTLLLAVARGESNFNPRAVSKANAIGIMQILWPQTARELGFRTKRELFDPCANIDAGARYLRKLLTRYDDNVHLAVAAYNYGPGRIQPEARRIQDGAAWYSGYILNHLNYVIGRSTPGADRHSPADYADEKRHTLMTFWKPQRAAAFVAYLREQSPSVRLDWFDRGLGRFSVDLLYQDDSEKRLAQRELQRVGIRL